ncbi:MAG: hypothetical protein ACTSXP_08620 [Promethearchaeota archaeon]
MVFRDFNALLVFSWLNFFVVVGYWIGKVKRELSNNKFGTDLFIRDGWIMIDDKQVWLTGNHDVYSDGR